MNRTAPIIAALLLLLPMLYVGSYLALVQPGWIQTDEHGNFIGNASYGCGDIGEVIFWPLEQIDRTVRPGMWET